MCIQIGSRLVFWKLYTQKLKGGSLSGSEQDNNQIMAVT